MGRGFRIFHLVGGENQNFIYLFYHISLGELRQKTFHLVGGENRMSAEKRWKDIYSLVLVDDVMEDFLDK